MTRQRVEHCAFLAVVLVIVLVTVCFTWPNYSKASELSAKADALDLKIGRLGDAEQDVEHRKASLRRLQSEHDAICLHVPDHPDVANLMNHLSMGVDGVAVLDQTFTVRGTPNAIGDDRFEVLPLVVELETNFGHAFDVIRRVEALDRLVRVTSVRMSSNQGEMERGASTITAAVGLDVVYEHTDRGGE
jgi:Tfp pilus assembly protein PilO